MMSGAAGMGDNHTRNFNAISREETLIMEETKGGEVSTSDFLAGLGIMPKGAFS